jgi:hypothetical protein
MASLKRIQFSTTIAAPVSKVFALMLPQTGKQVMELPSFTNKPVFVLSASKPLSEKSAIADDANEKRKDIARLYPERNKSGSIADTPYR